MKDMGDWSVNEMMKATALITEIGEMMCAEAMLGLMSGVVRDEANVDAKMIASMHETIRELQDAGGDDAIDRFVHVVTVMAKTSKVFLDGLVRGMELSGMTMPNPDTVVIPDTVPDDLRGPS